MSKNALKATLAGASGLVGQQCLQLLLADSRYDRVTVIVRRPLAATHPKLKSLLVDLGGAGSWGDLGEPDHFYCCLGTTIKQAGSRAAFRKVDYDYPLALARRAAATGLTRYLLISAMAANPRSRVFYNRVKGELEQQLAQQPIPSIDIFRPSLLMGERDESRPGEELGQKLMPLLNPLLRGGLKAYRPITAQQLAQAMVKAAFEPLAGVCIHEPGRDL